MKQNGFSLIEVLTAVLIVSILAAVSMPIYTRAIERSRAMEAMSNVKAINDAVYVYHADKEKCPSKFKQLVVTLPVAGALDSASVSTKYFTFTLGGAGVNVPGTPCPGVIATRLNGGDYQYSIYNSYHSAQGKAASLSCAPASENPKSQAICDALGLTADGSSPTEE